VPEFLDRMREQHWGLVPLAIEAVRHTLEVKKDARLAIKILRDLGIPRKIEERELPQDVTQQESEREASLRVRAIAEIIKRRMNEPEYRPTG
jgi:hypothetical protein